MMKLLNVLRRVITAPVGAWLWSRALDSFEKGQYRIALDDLTKLERTLGGKLRPRSALLKSVIQYKLGRYGEAENLALKVKERLRQRPLSRNSDENNYLIAYCSFLLRSIREKAGRPSAYDTRTEYAAFSVERVWSSTKKIFPLQDHQGWQKWCLAAKRR